MDQILPANALAFFPVQYFSQRELTEARSLSAARTSAGSAGIIHFGDTFGGARTALAGTTPHRAIDIMAPRGLPVFAATGGTVLATWTVYEEVSPGVRAPVQQPGIGTVSQSPNGDGGNYVVLVDGSGRHHYYAHLNEPAPVSIGQRVQAGQFLGHVGNTGRSARGTPPHLHYQVTTRPTPTARGPLVFWTPFGELVRLASALGGQRGRSGWRIEIAFDDFLRAVQTRHGVELVDPWSGAVTPALRHPWRRAF